jgi:hypothetical protein
MNRIKDKDTVKMLENVLNFSDEDKKILEENFVALLKYSSKESIIQQISEAIKNGRTDAKLFYGKVVDLFYFPIWEGNLPSWLPFWGGKFFTFFNAIFNVADMAISTGVGILIVFNKKAFAKT